MIQVAILTGTDVVDHLRTLELVESDLGLVLDTNYQENFEFNLTRMIEEATSWSDDEDAELVTE